MRIAVFPNARRDIDYFYTKELIRLIREAGGTVIVRSEDAAALFDSAQAAGNTVVIDDELDGADCLICLGGDGTFLSSLHLLPEKHLPTIGVNLGSVGFLTEIMPEAMPEAISLLMSGQYRIEERFMLSVLLQSRNGKTQRCHDALNDIVLSRGPSGRIVTIELQINNQLVEHMPGDGIIVSTPTGSTAYALSAGGPIIDPDLAMILITPICPHTLHNRSYITGEKSVVRLTLDEYPEPAAVSVDGQVNFFVQTGESIVISRSDTAFRLIRLGGDDFYRTLPAKIQLRGMTR